jgi:hypothetical protein
LNLSKESGVKPGFAKNLPQQPIAALAVNMVIVERRSEQILQQCVIVERRSEQILQQCRFLT